jgi:hypothetical protein
VALLQCLLQDHRRLTRYPLCALLLEHQQIAHVLGLPAGIHEIDLTVAGEDGVTGFFDCAAAGQLGNPGTPQSLSHLCE